MWRNYFKVAFRSMLKHRLHAGINILGLSMGLAFTVLIFLFVQNELAFNRFHKNKDRLFRILTSFHELDGGTGHTSPSLPLAVGPHIKEMFPEFKQFSRLAASNGVVRFGGRLFQERIHFADDDFFSMFTFPLIEGRPEQVLTSPNSVVLTTSIVQKYFGEISPVGKTMTLTFGNNTLDVVVTGVAEKVPGHSTIQFSILIPLQNLPLARGPRALTNLGDWAYPTYIELKEGVDPAGVERRLPQFTRNVFQSAFARWGEGQYKEKGIDPVSLHIQSVHDMYLDGKTGDSSDPNKILLLSGIALAVLLIACINFVNLSLARSSIRAKEIGLRKVVGAGKGQLMTQLWVESWLMVAFSLSLGIVLAALFLPTFNTLIEKRLELVDLFSLSTIGFLIVLSCLVALGSGSYPAWMTANFQPNSILRKELKLQRNSWLSKGLLMLQFALSVFLLTSTLFVTKQIQHMTNRPLGFKKEGVVSISTQLRSDTENFRLIRLFEQKLAGQSVVQSIGAANNAFGKGWSRYPTEIDGNKFDIYQYRVNPGYVPTLGLNLKQGRNFSATMASDTMATIINSSLARELAFDDPVGRTIGDPRRGYPYHLRIIGVVDDYHFQPLQYRIAPALLHMQPSWGLGNILVRIKTDQISESVKLLEETWQGLVPDKPFLFSFMDEDIESQYEDEKRWQIIVRFSSLVAVVIACMGVFGFTGVMLQRRVKEIGIRKVLGAGVTQLTMFLNREFLVIFLLANVPAWVGGYYAMNRLLQNYYYRIELGVAYFIVSGLIVLVVGLTSVSVISAKAASANPTKTLNYE